MKKFNVEISNILFWMVIISLIITPIAWQYKLLIMTIFMSLYHIINTGISEIKESLDEVIINQRIYATSEDELENLKNEIEKEHKAEELKAKMQKPIHNHIAARLYLIYIVAFIIMAGVMYLSEYPNLKNLLDTLN